MFVIYTRKNRRARARQLEMLTFLGTEKFPVLRALEATCKAGELSVGCVFPLCVTVAEH